MQYRVLKAFTEFHRGYKPGDILDDAALSCWQPEGACTLALSVLRRASVIELIDAAPAAKESALDQAETALHQAETAVENARTA